MRRRSKEPRRISVVEGKAAASLARASMTVSCFIYNDETPTRGFCQSLPQHLFQNCSCMSEGREIDPITNQPGQRNAQTVLWYRLSQAPAKPACDRIVREIVKPWQSNSLRVSRQKLTSTIAVTTAAATAIHLFLGS